jgi:hypothetical protein
MTILFEAMVSLLAKMSRFALLARERFSTGRNGV